MHISPQAVIFDLDGTLLNTIDDLADSCNNALTLLGHPTHPTDAYFYFVGNGIITLAERILPDNARSSAQIKECVDLIRSHYIKNWKSKTTVYPGIPDLLTSLQKKKIPVNILSNKDEDVVQTMVQYFLGDFSFRYVLGSIAGSEKKPDPERAMFLARKLQITPEYILFIGDSMVDMQTAENAGMISVGVTWGFRTKQELLENNAQLIIDRPMDLWDSLNL
jgi:phosphoglycolate phosphatase